MSHWATAASKYQPDKATERDRILCYADPDYCDYCGVFSIVTFDWVINYVELIAQPGLETEQKQQC